MSALYKYYAHELIQYNPQIGNGIKGFKQFSGPFFEGFPDPHATVEHMITEDNLVMTFLKHNSYTYVGILEGAAYQQNNCIGNWC